MTRADSQQQPVNLQAIPGLLPTLVALAAAFGSWALLLPVVPFAVIAAGGSDALAGATTGVFMATTVATQMLVPRALRTIGYTPVMVFAAMMLGLPALGHIPTLAAIPVLAISAIRGIGFGALTVAGSALIAELVPARLLGKASGISGFVIGFAELIALPAGLFLAQRFSPASAYVLAACVALIAAVMCARIPRIVAAEKPSAVSAATTPLWKLLIIPAAAISTVAMGFGVISSFLPTAVSTQDPYAGPLVGGIALSIVGGAQMVSRYAAGVYVDRVQVSGRLLIPALGLAALGLLLAALVITMQWPIWLVLIAALLFGVGFGAVQNEALLLMFTRLPRTYLSEASALWNMSFDSGTGFGSLALGFVALHWTYHSALMAGAWCVTLGLFAAIGEWLWMRNYRRT